MKSFVVVLGSAQDGSLPQLGAFHAQDLAAMNDNSLQRLGASIAVISEDGHCLLIDASPDLRYQYFQILLNISEYAEPRKKDPSMPIFHAIILTHAHMGHYLGLAHLGKEAANTKGIPTYVTSSMGQFLRSNAPWKQLVDLNNITLNEIDKLSSNIAYGASDPIQLWDGLQVALFTVPHRAEYTDTIGVSINGKVMYIPDIDSWEWPFVQKAFEDHEISLVDATFYDKSELGSIGRDVESIPHPSVLATISLFSNILDDKHSIVLTHLNHSNPICCETPERKATIAAGFKIAKENDRFSC